MKQTSIEWLIDQLQQTRSWHRVLEEISQKSTIEIDIIEQAKEMHKQEIIYAYEQAMETDVYNTPLKTGKQYYNETYKKD